MIVKHELKELESFTDHLKRMSVPHTLEIGSNTSYVKIENGGTHLFSDSFMKNKTLSFIKQVKKYALSTGIPHTGISIADISYVNFFGDTHTDRRYDNLVEIDLNSAYFVAALKLGIISREIFEKAKDIDKMSRLISLGSLAAQYEVYEVDSDGLSSYVGKRVDCTLRSYFFACCKEVDMLLGYIFDQLEDAVLGYWVDAVFLDKNFADAATEIINSFGYECKRKMIGSAHITSMDGNRVIYMTEKPIDETKGGRVKYFCI